MLQNLPSIVAAQVLNPQPGSRVLDMCAGELQIWHLSLQENGSSSILQYSGHHINLAILFSIAGIKAVCLASMKTFIGTYHCALMLAVSTLLSSCCVTLLPVLLLESLLLCCFMPLQLPEARPPCSRS
jgi:hypothetical protein